MPFDHFRISRAGAPGVHQKRAAAPCTNFYKTPTSGQTVDSLQTLSVSWDTTCLNTTQINMYLYEPGASDKALIHTWEFINYADGQYNATIMPRWWNSTSSVSLQLLIAPSNVPSYLSPLTSGPLFTATYTAPSSGTPPSANTGLQSEDQPITNVTGGLSNDTSHLSRGKVAAAVIMPILAIALAVFAYLKISRMRGQTKRKEWSEAVDKRMSTISTDWKAMSAAGANAAIRNSMAISGNRNSTFSFGAPRPSSTFATEGGQAGIGARSLYSQDNVSHPQMSQLRPGLRTSAFENRVSRVSFADGTRPSMESRRSRAYYTASTYEVPPLPSRQDIPQISEVEPTGLSPLQTSGAVSLSAEDIHTKIAYVKGQNNFDEVIPALSMMRTSGENDDEGSFYPAVPPVAHAKPADASQDYYQTVTAPATTIFSASPLSPNYPTSPISSFAGIMMQQPMPASVMSPDDMLKAYAERNLMARNGTPSSTGAASTYTLGAGTGYGATNPGIAYPSNAAASGRSLIPAAPGSYSPSRGAYGIDEEIGVAE